MKNAIKLFISMILVITLVYSADAWPGAITVIYPNGGEELSGTETVTAKVHDSFNSGDYLNVDFYYAKGLLPEVYIGSDYDCNENFCSVEWDTTNAQNGNDYKIHVYLRNITYPLGDDYSDAYFTVNNIAEMPDLIIQDISWTGGVGGFEMVISAEVKNIGTATAGTSNTEIAIDDAIGPTYCIEQTPTLLPDESTIVNCYVAYISEGSIITATADYLAEVTESNEDNNIRVEQYT